MRVYEVSALDANGDTISLVTTDTATGALEKLRGALTVYKRAWVTDDSGDNIETIELIQIARDEDRSA